MYVVIENAVKIGKKNTTKSKGITGRERERGKRKIIHMKSNASFNTFQYHSYTILLNVQQQADRIVLILHHSVTITGCN